MGDVQAAVVFEVRGRLIQTWGNSNPPSVGDPHVFSLDEVADNEYSPVIMLLAGTMDETGEVARLHGNVGSRQGRGPHDLAAQLKEESKRRRTLALARIRKGI